MMTASASFFRTVKVLVLTLTVVCRSQNPGAQSCDAVSGGCKGGSPSDYSVDAVGWLLYPFSLDEFGEKYYEKKPVLYKRPQSFHASLKDIEAEMLDAVAAQSTLPSGHTFVRVTQLQNGKKVDVKPFKMSQVTESGEVPEIPDSELGWDVDAVQYTFQQGFTVKVTDSQLYGPAGKNFHENLSGIGHQIKLNTYTTPPNSQGFDCHFDSHDVFIMQVHGKKHWLVYHELERFPLQDWTDDQLKPIRKKLGKPVVNAILEPGDVLYIPRGFLHKANCVGMDDYSTHITVGVYATTVANAVAKSLNTLRDEFKKEKNKPGQKLIDKLVEKLQVLERKDTKTRTSLPLMFPSLSGTSWLPMSAYNYTTSMLLEAVEKVKNVDDSTLQELKHVISEKLVSPSLLEDTKAHMIAKKHKRKAQEQLF